MMVTKNTLSANATDQWARRACAGQHFSDFFTRLH